MLDRLTFDAAKSFFPFGSGFGLLQPGFSAVPIGEHDPARHRQSCAQRLCRSADGNRSIWRRFDLRMVCARHTRRLFERRKNPGTQGRAHRSDNCSRPPMPAFAVGLSGAHLRHRSAFRGRRRGSLYCSPDASRAARAGRNAPRELCGRPKTSRRGIGASLRTEVPRRSATSAAQRSTCAGSSVGAPRTSGWFRQVRARPGMARFRGQKCLLLVYFRAASRESAQSAVAHNSQQCVARRAALKRVGSYIDVIFIESMADVGSGLRRRMADRPASARQ